MPELHLIRHGQASFRSENYDQLSALGHQQSRWLGEYYNQRDISFDHMFCGSLTRHRETLASLCQGMGTESDIEKLSLPIHPEWDEFNFRKVVESFVTRHPEHQLNPDAQTKDLFRQLKQAMLAWSKGDLDNLVPETWEQFSQRILRGLQHLNSEFPHAKRILVVSSGGAIAMAMKHALDLNNNMVANLNMQIMNTSVSRFILTSKQIHLSSFNHTPHLDHRERSATVTFS